MVESHRAAQQAGYGDLGKTNGLAWFERVSSKDGRQYVPELAQLNLSTAAIHNTSDLVTQVLLDLAEHPDMIPPLREEIASVLGEEGWTKAGLQRLKLLDSCIRETQRLKPLGVALMRRELRADFTLSDGTLLRKGSEFMVMGVSQWDPAVYKDPLTWDGYRFYRLRQQPGNEYAAQSVVTSPEHLTYGHGQHACPGRFFVASEVKIVMAHILIKYDWKIAKETQPRVFQIGLALLADPTAEIFIKRRKQQDIDLDSLYTSQR